MSLQTALAYTIICATAALEAVPADAFQKVARGNVAVIDNFLARDVVAALRDDAEELWDAGLYSVATRVLARLSPRPSQQRRRRRATRSSSGGTSASF